MLILASEEWGSAVISELIGTFRSRPHREAAIPGLDGLRCYAAISVILSHSKLGATGWGAAGVWLFFVLSGMLLTPGLLRGIRSSNLVREVLAYLIRRIFRILPAFAFVLAVFCAVTWRPENAWFNYSAFRDHITFKLALWHFWTIKSELLLYLILPVAVASLAFLRGWKLAAVAVLVLAGTYAVTEYWVLIKIRATPTLQQGLYATPLVMGMVLALLNPTVSDGTRKLCFWIGAIGLMVLSSDIDLIKAAREMIGIHGISLPWRKTYLVYPFAALTVFGATGNKSWILNNRVVQVLGIIGFSIYLWQTFVLTRLESYGVRDPMLLFAAALPLTVFLSALTYLFIEVPGQRLGSYIAKAVSSWELPFTRKVPVNQSASAPASVTSMHS